MIATFTLTSLKDVSAINGALKEQFAKVHVLAEEYEKKTHKIEVKDSGISGEDIFNAKCSACHRFDTKLVGPPYKETLPKYNDNVKKVAAFVYNPVKMNPDYPAMPNQGLKPKEAEAVAQYILTKSSIDNFDYYKSLNLTEAKRAFPIHAFFLLAELKSVNSLYAALAFLSQPKEALTFWCGKYTKELMWEVVYNLGSSSLEFLKKFLLNGINPLESNKVIIKAVSQIALHEPERKEEILAWYKSIIYYLMQARYEDYHYPFALTGTVVSGILDIHGVELFNEKAELIELRKKLVVLTGAGISAESGISTFRDAGGLWEGYDVTEVASLQGWKQNKELVLEFYNQRRKQILNAEPNSAHFALASLEADFDVTIITQNIDDLHERGGSSNVIHLHGEIKKSRSTVDHNLRYDISGNDLIVGDKCEKGSQLRPDIVWFGELVPMIETAISYCVQADIFVVIGTSMVVYPAASLIEFVPAETLKYVIDPNKPGIYYPPPNTVYIEKKSTDGMKELAKILVK
ncbi:unnamed protein product [Rotaria sp. Silwood1]|nr:unnamed protein product [Rotaria sp. Silwood1]